MEKEKAKEYMYIPYDKKIIYASNNLDNIRNIDNNANLLYRVYAVLETPIGAKLFHMDFDHSFEPVITRCFLHVNFILNSYKDREIIWI